MKFVSVLGLLIASAVHAQSVALPDVVSGMPGQWVIIAPKAVDGGKPNWRLDPGLTEVDLAGLLPSEYVDKLRGKVVSAKTVGQYKVEAWNAKGDVASPIATTWVIIGTPEPTPIPPSPTPIPTPDNVPIPVAGFRVLMVYETTELPKLPAAQQIIPYSKTIRDYLDAKCVLGGDNKTREYRIFDKDIDTKFESAVWQNAMKRTRTSIPWIVISDGKTGYEGPLPQTVADTLALLKKYGGE